jgi:hypothetical protein
LLMFFKGLVRLWRIQWVRGPTKLEKDHLN